MDGKFNSFIGWIDESIEGKESIVSNDIDMFIDLKSKKEWLILGLSLWALAKEVLKQRGVNYDTVLCLTLNETKTPNNIPGKITDRLFGHVLTPPTLYLSKEKAYFPHLFSQDYIELNHATIDLGFDCRVFYREEKDEDIIYRHIMLF